MMLVQIDIITFTRWKLALFSNSALKLVDGDVKLTIYFTYNIVVLVGLIPMY